MSWLYPFFKLKIHQEGYLNKPKHRIYYRAYGNPQGIPVLSFHGGPGGGSNEKYAKLFDFKKYYFIQFDQRGGCRSETKDFLYKNTTQNLIQDAHDILNLLKIKRKIIVHGVSWGSTLALVFAETYPKLVQNIIVSAVFLARPYDTDWVKKDSIRFYPDLWTTMQNQLPESKNIRQKYYKMLFSDNPEDNNKALSYLGSYEYMLGSLDPHFTKRTELNAQELQETRIAFYYEKNNYFLENDQILKNADKIKDIPTLITHNRMDFCCPVQQAWDLHLKLPQSTLIIVPDYGHTSKRLTKETKYQIKNFI